MSGTDRRAGGRDWHTPDAGLRAHSGDTLPPTQAVRPPGPSRKTLALSVLGTAVMIIIVGTAVLLSTHSGFGQSSSASSATPTGGNSATILPPTPTPKTAPPAPHATPGWASAGPSFAINIAFAPNDPLTAYVCGPDPSTPPAPNGAFLPSSSNPQRQLAVGVSHDGGATWHIYSTPAHDAGCSLNISPTNAAEVALVGDPNAFGCAPCSGSDVFISTDGGRQWVSQVLPPEYAGQQVGPGIDAVAWAGDILFATPHEDFGQSLPHALAESVSGGPFQWADQSALPSLANKQPRIGELFSQGTALYALVDDGACPSTCYQLVRSTDGGATWMVPSGNFSGYVQAWAGMDGTTLYALAARGAAPADTLVVSYDVGNTWYALAKLPGTIAPGQNVFALSDGTVYCALNGIPAGAGIPSTPGGVYRLSPGARTWKYVGPLPAADTLLAVQWGTDGRALALWGQGNFDATRGGVEPGLQRHAP